jgi:tetratricopeptide (TPR) repeat protein
VRRWFANPETAILRRSRDPIAQPPAPTVKPLSDASYESLFMRLLDRAAAGASPDELSALLERRADDRFFHSWLRRFGQKSIDSPLPQPELTVKLEQFGQSEGGKLGEIAAGIALQLRDRSSQPLSDRDYQILWEYLLEKVNLGWEQPQVRQFLQGLESRGTVGDWIAWLDRTGEQWLTASEGEGEVSEAIERLSELTEGELSDRLGQMADGVRQRATHPPTSPDLDAAILRPTRDAIAHSPTPTSPPTGLPVFEGLELPDNPGVKAVSLEELWDLMQQDPDLVRQIADRLQVDSTNPQELIEILEAQQWGREGTDLYLNGDLDGALAAFDRVVKRRPNDALMWGLRGDILRDLERFDEAIAAYDRALELDPDDRQIRQQREDLERERESGMQE